MALADLAGAQNAFMSKISQGLPPTTNAPTGVQTGLIGSNPTLAMTTKVPAGLVAGAPGFISGTAPTQNVSNYPAAVNVGTFPFSGVS